MCMHGHHLNEIGFSDEAELKAITSRRFGDKVGISHYTFNIQDLFQPNIEKVEEEVGVEEEEDEEEEEDGINPLVYYLLSYQDQL